MKICLTTLMDDNFYIGFVGFIKSFLANNEWFDYDFVIFDGGLSEPVKEKMLEFYPKIIFKEINKSRYSEVNFNKTHAKLQKTYYKLEAFSLFEYDRVIQMDVDMTIMGDVKDIFEATGGICACKQYRADSDKLAIAINSGVFVINKEFLNQEVYEELIITATKGFSMPDQKVINSYFANRITYLPKKYNCEKRMYHSIKHNDIWNEKIVLHWIAEKPWEKMKTNDGKRFIEIEEIWWYWYNK